MDRLSECAKSKEGKEMIAFKSDTELEEFPKLRRRAQLIALEMGQYCADRGQTFIITDILSEASEDAKLKRVSTSHREGRAFDIRTRHWPVKFREEFIAHFYERFKSWAAISKKTLKPHLIEYHDNDNGIHCHIQIKHYKD